MAKKKATKKKATKKKATKKKATKKKAAKKKAAKKKAAKKKAAKKKATRRKKGAGGRGRSVLPLPPPARPAPVESLALEYPLEVKDEHYCGVGACVPDLLSFSGWISCTDVGGDACPLEKDCQCIVIST